MSLFRKTFRVEFKNVDFIFQLMTAMNFTEESRSIIQCSNDIIVYITFVGKKEDLNTNLVLCYRRPQCRDVFYSFYHPDGSETYRYVYESIKNRKCDEILIKEIIVKPEQV